MWLPQDIIDYLLETYSPVGSYDSKALWPMRGRFAEYTATLSTIFRGLAGGTSPDNVLSTNTEVLPITMYGYECSPFVKSVREVRACKSQITSPVVSQLTSYCSSSTH